MLPTPSTSHANYSQVYEPAEDSFLLLETFDSKSERDFLNSQYAAHTGALMVCEVGTGSGVVLALVTANSGSIFGRDDIKTIGTDVNPFACQTTLKTVQVASEEAVVRQLKPANFLGCFKRDLLTGFLPGSLDMVIFNPPYVPSPDVPEWTKTLAIEDLTGHERFMRDQHLLALSCDGGRDGMETTNRLLAQLSNVLSPSGVAYILLCTQNMPHEVATRVRAWGQEWNAELVRTSGKTAGWEKLSIMRIWREPQL